MGVQIPRCPYGSAEGNLVTLGEWETEGWMGIPRPFLLNASIVIQNLRAALRVLGRPGGGRPRV